jgi:ABC-type phosphate transport system substrate-binding protein
MRKITIAILIMILFRFSSGAAYPEDIAIIVNNQNQTEELSFKDLVKIFKREKQYWKDGKKIYLVMQEAGSSEKEIVLKEIYRMNDEELKKFWLAKMFRGEISSFPKTLGSNEAVKRFVSQGSNAIGFIGSSLTDKSVKVLRIDGKLPDDKDYRLADRVKGED